MKALKKTFLFLTAAVLLCGCGYSSGQEAEIPSSQDLITVGFTQVGAESDWRLACSASVQKALTVENGFNLIFNDAQQKQENQIKAVREFIDQNVDYIIIDPITEIGWESTLMEARDAAIPVIIVDRRVDVQDPSLYTAWIGSDFKLEGDLACGWLKAYLDAKGIHGRINIADIQGTLDSSAQLGRTKALEDAEKRYPNWHIVAKESGEFTKAKGFEVMEKMLKTHRDSINVVYCENDNEAFGAKEAIEKTGKHIGTDFEHGDIMLISFDSTRAGLLLTQSGDISTNVECNPEYGPKLLKMIEALERGETLIHDQYIDEQIFSAEPLVVSVWTGSQKKKVTLLSDEIIKERNY